jgi:zinc protease
VKRSVPLTLAAAAFAAFGPLSAAEPGPDRSRPPAPGPVRPLTLPEVQELALGSGLGVRLVESHGVPVATVLLVVRSGAAADPAGKEGLAAMTAAMLDEGAGGKDALALDDALTFLGARLDIWTWWDATIVALSVPSARLEPALSLVADVVLRPDFSAKELERLREEALSRLLQARAEPGAIGSRALAAAVFGSTHRYGRPVNGGAASIAAFTPDALKAFHAEHYRPGNAFLVVTGDVVPAALTPLLEKAFGAGAWPAGGRAPNPLPPPAQLTGRVVWLVDKPGAAQSVIRIGRVGPDRRSVDYFPAEVMNTLLGGSFTSRLNDNLREKRGYTYGASSWFDYRLSGGSFSAGADVQTNVTGEAMTEFLKELERIRTPAAMREVERARTYMALRLPQELETTDQLAGELANQALHSLPDDYLATYVEKTLAVTPEALRKAAREHVDPARMAYVVVGDLATIRKPIEALKLGPVRVLTLDEVMGPAPKVE